LECISKKNEAEKLAQECEDDPLLCEEMIEDGKLTEKFTDEEQLSE